MAQPVIAGPIGFHIKERRREQGTTQVALAKKLGISPSYLNLIEADKRAVGGTLLQKIAKALNLDLDQLSGLRERRLIDRLAELTADPMIERVGIDPASAGSLVSRHPEWATAILVLADAYRDSEQHNAALSERIDQDPALADAVHKVLNVSAAVRSTTEILTDVNDLSDDERARFVSMILSQSGTLSRTAEQLVALFDAGGRKRRSLPPVEEVEDFFVQNKAYFPDLEALADDLRARLSTSGETSTNALAEFLVERHGITIATIGPENADFTEFHNFSRYDADGRHLTLLESIPETTRRFQLTRLAIQLTEPAALAPLLDTETLTSRAARERAKTALISYTAAAILFPYDRFLEDAIRVRYDIELLRQHFLGSFAQICQRLVSLQKPGAEGIPFGFFRTDPSGHIRKRHPIPGLPVPRLGAGCPLWPLYAAFQTPDRMLRQLAEFPNGSRFLFVARTVRHEPYRFHAAPFLQAVMMACDALYADQTVYADGLDLSARRMVTPVGPACRLCPRTDCPHRGESSILRSTGGDTRP